jgi:hypothetical protein
MAKNGIVTQYDDAGFPAQAATNFVVAAASGLQLIKGGAGRLLKVIVTVATTTNPVTFYDNATGAASGTVLLVVPAAATAGTIYDVNLPAANGITVNGAMVAGAITVGYA